MPAQKSVRYLTAVGTSCATGSNDCGNDVWCDDSMGLYREVGPGYFSDIGDCARHTCTSIDSQLVDEQGHPATSPLFGIEVNLAPPYGVSFGPKPHEVAQYITTGHEAGDECEWACTQSGYYREVSLLPSGARQFRCLKANRGYYSLPMSNALVTW